MLNRWVETEGLLDTLTDVGAGCIAFSPLAQGMLTDKYLDGVPEGSRASQDKSLSTDLLTDEAIGHIRTLNELAGGRGQTLAQMALAWALRNPEVSSVLVGASPRSRSATTWPRWATCPSPRTSCASIDQHARDSGIDLWASARAEGGRD